MLVASFRKPEFQVDVRAGRASYVDGDAIDAGVAASYFFGGAVDGASVDWSVLADPFFLRPKGFEGYSFSDFDFAGLERPLAPQHGAERAGAFARASDHPAVRHRDGPAQPVLGRPTRHRRRHVGRREAHADAQPRPRLTHLRNPGPRRHRTAEGRGRQRQEPVQRRSVHVEGGAHDRHVLVPHG